MNQPPLIQELVARLYTRSRLDQLPAHIGERYGISVTGHSRLDGGVYRIFRSEGAPWVARIFPAARPLASVEGDAEVLRLLGAQGYPAERCAHVEPVSVLDGQGVLITEFVTGAKAGMDDAGLREMGWLLGRLQASGPVTGAAAREAGSLHHWSVQGGPPRTDIDAALGWIDATEEGVGQDQRDQLASLRAAVAGLDDLGALPRSFVHPDFQPENIIRSPDGRLTVIDWADSGRGPRIVSLAILLNFAVRSAAGLDAVDAVVAGYRESVTLEPAEIDLLPDALRRPPLLLDCFIFCLGRKALPEVLAGIEASAVRSQAVAARVRRAYEG